MHAKAANPANIVAQCGSHSKIGILIQIYTAVVLFSLPKIVFGTFCIHLSTHNFSDNPKFPDAIVLLKYQEDSGALAVQKCKKCQHQQQWAMKSGRHSDRLAMGMQNQRID